jgi:hypothetical protein
MKRRCDSCGGSYDAIRPNSRFCGATCRKRGSRGHVIAEVPSTATPARAVDLPMTAAVRRQLEEVDRAGTYLGAAALSLAARIDAATAAVGFAALVKELRATMDAALEGTGRTADLVDELRARRDRRNAG